MRTSLYSILCIVVRLGAVMLFVETVIALPWSWSGLLGSDDEASRGMLIGFSGASIGLAATLWLYPGLLARMAAGTSSREVFESPIAAKDLQFVALSVLGVAFAIKGLVGLVAVLFRVALSAQYSDAAWQTLVWQNGANLLVQVLQFAVGIGLTFGASGLNGLLYRLRERGLPPAQADD